MGNQLKTCLGLFAFAFMIALTSVVSAENITATVCCEKTVAGAFCQNVPASACDPSARQAPTACESTSYCRSGTCYDSNEGTCLDNTPQLVCNTNGGIWSAESPAQCQRGCCLLGDQAAFVSLVRCKKLSGFLGLKTNYDSSITSEVACVAAIQQQDKGACVYEFEFQKACTFTTRAECTGSSTAQNGSVSAGLFYKDKLCSAEELGTVCGPSQKTTCLPGKDEIYYLDTCGNPANIYDASQWNNKAYWTTVKEKQNSCSPSSANADSRSCGNCNYLLGSVCRSARFGDTRPTYGDSICVDLNCVDETGKARKHGESWCLADDARKTPGKSSVGSRSFRRVCMNGDVVTEPCDDFRAQECVEDKIDTPYGPFAQAACRVNRWQDCLAQTDKQDCENTDRRDCFWREGVTLGNNTINGACLPQTAPGLNFWTGEESRTVCGVGNKICVVKFEKGLLGGQTCKENCECLQPGWETKYGEVCAALGDCGAKVNYVGKVGFKQGIQVKINGEIRKSS